jgi:hypothetical protein
MDVRANCNKWKDGDLKQKQDKKKLHNRQVKRQTEFRFIQIFVINLWVEKWKKNVVLWPYLFFFFLMIGIFFTRKYCILYIVDSDFFLDSIMDLHINMNECMYTSLVGVGWPVLAGRQTVFSDSLLIFFDWKYVDVFSADIVSIFSARRVIVGCTSVKLYSVAYQMIFKIKKHRFFLPKKTSIQWHGGHFENLPIFSPY